jgi:hypothetical protein
MPKITNCEVKGANGRWTVISIDQALDLPRKNTVFRCVECAGRLISFKEAHDGSKGAHFEHRPAWKGCSLTYIFSGNREINPDRID